MKKSLRGLLVVSGLVIAGICQGCASSAALVCRPDPLVKPEIRFDDLAHRHLFGEHVYFSKEGSSSGHGIGGGGCGCN